MFPSEPLSKLDRGGWVCQLLEGSGQERHSALFQSPLLIARWRDRDRYGSPGHSPRYTSVVAIQCVIPPLS